MAPLKPQPTSPPSTTTSITRFTRSSSSSLTALQSLPEPCMLVLFTPTMPPLTKTKDPIDPFEALGRSLSARHAHVRHVPYVPRVGFTNLHLPWLRQAHAIVVVISEPCISSGAGAGASNVRESIANQEKFAQSMIAHLASLRPTDGGQVTLSLICCGAATRAVQGLGFQNVLVARGYGVAELEDVVGLLMGG